MRKQRSKTVSQRIMRSRSCGGFTLIEVLITMLVISVGLLGIAVMQMKGMQFAHSSFERSIAVAQANDLADRLWTRICDLPEQDEIDEIFDAWVKDHTDPSHNPYAPDLQSWTSPGLAYDATGGLLTYKITIQWSDSRAPEAGTDPAANFEFAYYAGIPVLSCD